MNGAFFRGTVTVIRPVQIYIYIYIYREVLYRVEISRRFSTVIVCQIRLKSRFRAKVC